MSPTISFLLFALVFYFLGFLINFCILMNGTETIAKIIKDKIDKPTTDVEWKIHDYFSNIAEKNGEEFATRRFYRSLVFLFVGTSSIWPYFLFHFLKNKI